MSSGSPLLRSSLWACNLHNSSGHRQKCLLQFTGPSAAVHSSVHLPAAPPGSSPARWSKTELIPQSGNSRRNSARGVGCPAAAPGVRGAALTSPLLSLLATTTAAATTRQHQEERCPHTVTPTQPRPRRLGYPSPGHQTMPRVQPRTSTRSLTATAATDVPSAVGSRDERRSSGPLLRSSEVSAAGPGPSLAPGTEVAAAAVERQGGPGAEAAARSSAGSAVPLGGDDGGGVAAAGAAAVAPESGGGGSVTAEEIARRIAASRARRATRLSYNCPACTISAATPVNIARHVARCCPDLMAPHEAAWSELESLPRGYPSPQHDRVVGLLRAAGEREMELRRRVLECVFWSGPVDPETGLPARLEAEEAARRLRLPLSRAASLLQRAMASVPLASDPGDPPLDVLYEDEHFLAVNKPVGLHTAPIHRFTGGSVVNKVIAYLNRQRRGGRAAAEEQQQVTLLTPYGTDVPYGYLPPLMPVPEPFSVSSPSADSSTSSAGSEDDDLAPAASGGSGGGQPYQLEPYVLHRLDMNTSGLLLFAKRPEVVAGMHRQFRERTLTKLYVAAAVGCPPSPHLDRFDVDAPIDRHPSEPVVRVVAPSGKEAATSFAVLARSPSADLGTAAGGAPGLFFHHRPDSSPLSPLRGPPSPRAPSPQAAAATGSEGQSGPHGVTGPPGAGSPGPARTPPGATIPPGASLLVCAPHTGRTHQIRVHLHHVGHPIVGDDIYGVTGPWLSRQALHAACLRFTHPLTGREMQLAAPLHPDMAACLERLGLPQPDVGALAEQWRELAEAGGGGGKKRADAGARGARAKRQRG